jgi:DNA-binding LacI/PurR family transcriptional regulator
MPAPATVTLKDVARHAKVAVWTASKCLNGDPSVRPRLRARVLKTATDLGYRLNPLARAMATRSSNLVTLSIFELGSPFYGLIADHLTRQLDEIGLVSIFCANSDRVVEFNNGFCASGSILISPSALDVNRIAVHHPVVTIQCQDYEGQAAPDVSMDLATAYRELTQRAIMIGRRRFAFFCKPVSAVFHTKFQSVMQVLLEHGLSHVPLPEEAMSSAASLASLLSTHPGSVDAIFCRTDRETATLLTALSACSIRVPDDVLLIASDGTISLPGVWSAVADVEGLVSEAVRLLRSQLSGSRTKESVVVSVPLSTPTAASPRPKATSV